MFKLILNLIYNIKQIVMLNIYIYVLNKEYACFKKNVIYRDFDDMLNSPKFKNHNQYVYKKLELNKTYADLDNLLKEIPYEEITKDIFITIIIILVIYFLFFNNNTNTTNTRGINIDEVHDLINNIFNLYHNDPNVIKRINMIRLELKRMLYTVEKDLNFYDLDQIKQFIIYIIENSGKGG